MPPHTQPSLVPSLQALRLLAALSVVYLHTGAAPRFGSFGVDIFFVISGYVMAYLSLRQPTAGAFVRQRIARIVPLYWLVTTALMGLAMWHPEWMHATRADWGQYLQSLLFIPYFKEPGVLHPMLVVGWTLNYEAFFYACMALSLAVAPKHPLWTTAALVALAHGVLGRGDMQTEVAANFFGNPAILEFLLGMALFALVQRTRHRPLPGPLALGVAVLAYGFMAASESRQLDGPYLLVYGLPATLVVWGTVRADAWLQETLGAGMGWLSLGGDASYALYLSHYFVVEAVKKLTARLGAEWGPQAFWPSTLLTLALALAVGLVIYRLADRPLHQALRGRV